MAVISIRVVLSGCERNKVDAPLELSGHSEGRDTYSYPLRSPDSLGEPAGLRVVATQVNRHWEGDSTGFTLSLFCVVGLQLMTRPHLCLQQGRGRGSRARRVEKLCQKLLSVGVLGIQFPQVKAARARIRHSGGLSLALETSLSPAFETALTQMEQICFLLRE